MTASSGGEERGARFTVRLPLMRASVDQEFTAPASSGSALLDGLSFLLVDDDVAAQEVLAHLLRNLGAQVHTATGAADALNCLEAGSFDILITDLAMPGADGHTLLRRIRQQKGTGDASTL